jgi:cellulose 1,4-beta-cellobiosidase
MRCTKAAGCVEEETTVTLDANWRWTHEASGYQNCYTDGEWSTEYCTDSAACAASCAVEGVDKQGYKESYGIKKVADGIELQFVAPKGNVGSRVYLLDGKESYKMFKLKNREFTLDVETSSLACGLNGAVYFVEMDADGGKGVGDNDAGAKFGTGYCDAQCPHDIKWIEGEANVDGESGICCFEMDIWEANRRATAYIAHPCKKDGPFKCKGASCGDGQEGRYSGVCDKDGCDLNTYRMGNPSFYGMGDQFEVDSRKPLTVVTQFLTNDGTDSGDLVEIRQLYLQNGKVMKSPDSTTAGVKGNAITDEFCTAQKSVFSDPNDFKKKGGLKNMGESLDRGMVLTLSLWDDQATEMRWLDSTFPVGEPATEPGNARGPCDDQDNSPNHLRSVHQHATVKYSNIKYGEIGSTFESDARRLSQVLV